MYSVPRVFFVGAVFFFVFVFFVEMAPVSACVMTLIRRDLIGEYVFVYQRDNMKFYVFIYLKLFAWMPTFVKRSIHVQSLICKTPSPKFVVL